MQTVENRLNFMLSFHEIKAIHPNKFDDDWYWPVEILFTSAFFSLFDQPLHQSFLL